MTHHHSQLALDLRYRLIASLIPSTFGFLTKAIKSSDVSNLSLFNYPEIYNDYFGFLFLMTFLEIVTRIAKQVFTPKKTLKNQANNFIAGMNLDAVINYLSRNEQSLIKPMFIAIVSYTIIFFIYQAIIGLAILKLIQSNSNPTLEIQNHLIQTRSSDAPTINLDQEDLPLPIPRILEEDQKISEDSILLDHPQEETYLMMSSSRRPSQIPNEKFTLTMANINSVLDLKASAFVLSADQKIVFAVVSWSIKIIDISNLKSPKAIGSVSFGKPTSYNGNVLSALALSSDEKTLFFSNFMQLSIIDITNLNSPKQVFFTKTNIIPDDDLQKSVKQFRASLAIDESTQTLFIGGLGLIVYDVSNLTEPKLLKAVANQPDYAIIYAIFNETEVKLSLNQDQKVLFLANGTLDIYNISNPKDIQLISSIETSSTAASLQFTSDSNRILTLGLDENGMSIDEIDVSNYSFPKIIKSNNHYFGSQLFKIARFLAASPGQNLFIILTNAMGDYSSPTGLFTFNDQKKTFTKESRASIKYPLAFEVLQNGKHVITLSNSQFFILEPLQNYPNTEIFDFNFNQISSLRPPGSYQQMKLSPDGKTMFLVTDGFFGASEVSFFQIWNMTDLNAPNQLFSRYMNSNLVSMYFNENYKTAYMLFEDQIFVIDLSDFSSLNIIGYLKHKESDLKFSHLCVTSDEQIGVAIMEKDKKNMITGFNFSYSNSSEIQKFWTLDHPCPFYDCKIFLKDNRTLLVVDKNITIYQISNTKSSPVLIASLSIVLSDTMTIPEIDSAQLSPDKKTLFVSVYETQGLYRLQIYNISAPRSPYLLTEHSFYKNDGSLSYSGDFITFTPDFKTGFIQNKQILYKVRIQPEEVKIIGQIQISDDRKPKFIISPDGQTIYTGTTSGINIISTHIQQTFYLKQERFALGEKYSDQTMMLNRTGLSDYSLLDRNSYKIIKLSLADFKISPSKTAPDFIESPLPTWVAFDCETDLLTLEPKNRNDLGDYTLQAAASMKIPENAFNALVLSFNKGGYIDGEITPEDLLAWLISLGYIDNELFLTESFLSIQALPTGDLKNFYLPSMFSPIKQKIYNILKRYYVKTFTTIEIVSSLEFNLGKENLITIFTPASDHLKVDIDLISPIGTGSKARFLHKSYPSLSSFITNQKSRLHLEGALEDINIVLKDLIVDFTKNNTICDASFTIQDGLNRPLTLSLKNASKLFTPNTPPALQKPIQNQVDSIDIYTSQHFTIEFEQDTFKTNYTDDPLTYELVMAKNQTHPPKWLTLSGLKLRGIPPEEVISDIELVIIAKNEFKQIREPFKLKVKISLAYSLKLLLKYLSSLLSIVGLIVSLNKIWNIVGQKFYKHPKEYVLNSGEKLTAETIAPIFFIGKEKQEAKLIIKHLEKHISDQLQLESITRSQFINYFILDSDQKELDKQKIFNIIDDVIQSLPPKDKENLERYCSVKKSRKLFIQQLIIDQLILWQLDQDLQTKSVFEKIKDRWSEITYWDPSFSLFSLNQDKFDQILKEKSSSPDFDLSQTNDTSLLMPGEINSNLLQDSVLAFTSGVHQISESPLQVGVSMKEQVKSNILFKLLKLDLLSTHKIDYGINYSIADDILNFTGIAKEYLQGRTLVIQITTIRNRILKEIRIHGIPESPMNKQEITDYLSNENKYEAF